MTKNFQGLCYYILLSVLSVTFLLCNTGAAFGQVTTFSPATEDLAVLNTLLTKHEKIYKDYLTRLPSEHKKDFEEVYKQRWNNIKERFDNKEIYTATAAQQYLDALVAQIVQGNPLLQKQQFQCYFSRSGVPNASYLGEGVILFNMGLFKRLENESQAAFVICHELAHFYLQHIENNIRSYVTTINSKALQSELKKIKSTEYGKREQYESLVKGLTFNSRRHSRDHEGQADSMAVEFMRGTPYDVREATAVLHILDTIDHIKFNTALALQQVFNASEYPFQKKWVAKEEGLLGGHAQLKKDEALADSLKTHPDCKLRIELLSPAIERYTSTASKKNVVNAAKFAELRTGFQYEIIEYAYAAQNYTRSLYYTLELLQEQPSDPYLVTQTGKIFNNLYKAQKSHQLNKVIDLPAPYYPAGYNLILQFVQNLYLENIASINHYFLKRFYPQLQTYPPFKNEYDTSMQLLQQ